ncbi:unnamed protein product [Caenorhabditis angaria]|uniref:WAP domain-containing protein n=1 Tax=Caenorhabditis angaria TaxID=860376 RepID=A0A9P1IY13_9PELO|nr:unnamed protein product [Caenorhabditis angaria]
MKLDLFFLLLFLQICDIFSNSSPRTRKLCLYLKAIKRTTVECSGNLIEITEEKESSSMSPLARIIANIEKRNEKYRKAKQCTEKYKDGFKDCRADSSCFSGFSCENTKQSRCCMEENVFQNSESTKTCPTINQMNYFCAKKSSKKCQNDSDCLFSGIQKCCYTGCGFNVCVVARGNFAKNGMNH